MAEALLHSHLRTMVASAVVIAQDSILRTVQAYCAGVKHAIVRILYGRRRAGSRVRFEDRGVPEAVALKLLRQLARVAHLDIHIVSELPLDGKAHGLGIRRHQVLVRQNLCGRQRNSAFLKRKSADSRATKISRWI